MKLVLFDLDDTLLDERQSVLAGVQKLHAAHAPEYDFSTFHSGWIKASHQQFQHYLDGKISFEEQRRNRVREMLQSDFDDKAADDIFTVYLAGYEQSWSLFDDALPCLSALKHFQLGIVTNATSVQQKKKLSRLNILQHFSFVVAVDDAGCAKPDAKIFYHACSLAGVSPADAMHIGDLHHHDAVGAASAGLNAVWLNRLNDEKSSNELPIRTIHNLDELLLLDMLK